MEKSELDKLVIQWREEKQKSPSRVNRPLTYTLYNELLKPKMKRSEKDCTCLDRDTDYKVTRHIEQHYKVEEPLPIQSNVKIDFSDMMNEEEFADKFAEANGIELPETPKSETISLPKKTTRKKRTTKKKTTSAKTKRQGTDS